MLSLLKLGVAMVTEKEDKVFEGDNADEEFW